MALSGMSNLTGMRDTSSQDHMVLADLTLLPIPSALLITDRLWGFVCLFGTVFLCVISVAICVRVLITERLSQQ